MATHRERVEISIDARPLRTALIRGSIAVVVIGTSCNTCKEYLAVREWAIAHYLTTTLVPDAIGDAVERLVAGAHRRHLEDLPILPAAAA